MDGETRFLALSDKLRCHDLTGNVLWVADFEHGQHMIPGCFRPDLGLIQFAVLDISDGSIHLLNWRGESLWSQSLNMTENCQWIGMTGINWLGHELGQCMAVYSLEGYPTIIFDGFGNRIVELKFVRHDGSDSSPRYYLTATDVWGDSRDEALLVSSEGAVFYASVGLYLQPSQYNFTWYKGL